MTKKAFTFGESFFCYERFWFIKIKITPQIAFFVLCLESFEP